MARNKWDGLLKSRDIKLRPVRLADAEFLFRCERDPEARRNFMSADTRKEVISKIMESVKEMRKRAPKSERFAVEWNGQLVGEIGIRRDLDNKSEAHQARIGFMIHKDFRGRGINTEAVKLITNYAFKRYKVRRIWTYVRTFNTGSRRSLEKAGYKLEGVLRKNKFKDGKYLDDCIYAMVK